MTGEVTREEMIAAVRRAEALAEYHVRYWSDYPNSSVSLGAAAQLAGIRAALRELEAGGWRPISQDQRDGEVYLLWREEGLDPFIGYWDEQFRGWFSLAGAYVMEPAATHYLPLSVLPSPPGTSDGGGE